MQGKLTPENQAWLKYLRHIVQSLAGIFLWGTLM